MGTYRTYRLDDAIAITKALGDTQRVRALMALRHGELCVCQLTELLNLAPSTVSKHMSQLKQACLVEFRKDGRWTYYRLCADDLFPEAISAIAWLEETLGEDSQIRADAERLKAIIKIGREVLCRRQTSK